MANLKEDQNVDNYNKIYETMEYDHAFPNTNLVRLEKWFLKNPGKTLDHGFGYGENLIFLCKKGYHVTGLEISKNLIDYVNIKCKIKQVPPHFYKLNLMDDNKNLNYNNEEFDHVISLGVLEMLANREFAKHCIEELCRVLKKGGKMIVSTLAPENSFVINAEKQINEEEFYFSGEEEDKTVKVDYHLFIPKSKKSFSELFPSTVNVTEIGSWDNEYCNVKGTHYVALVEKPM